MVRRQVNDLSFKIGISVQQIFVSQKFMELVVKSKKYSRQSLINNLLLIRHVISAMPTMLPTLLDIFVNTLLKKRTAIGKHLLKADGSLCHLNKNQLRMQMPHKVWMPYEWDTVDQITQSTPQQKNRLNPSETSTLTLLLPRGSPLTRKIVRRYKCHKGAYGS